MKMYGFENVCRWREITPSKVKEELPKLIASAEEGIAEIENSNPATFEDFIWKLSDCTYEMSKMTSAMHHLLSVVNSDEWRKTYEELMPMMVSFSMRMGQSEKLYSHAKRILADMKANNADGANDCRIRILEEEVRGFEHSGVGLDGEKKKRFCEIAEELNKIGTNFSNAVLDATKAYSYEKDGNVYTIDDANYPETMKHCPDSGVRETLYRARVGRAPENTERIKKILELRREKAKLLGFEDYASLSIDSKCAPSAGAVMEMIDKLDMATVKIAEKESKELGSDVAPWDVAYFAERLREEKYSYSEEELKKYFNFSDVLAGLFKISKFLFGVDVEEIAEENLPQTWHKDVRVFSVLREGDEIARFYLDPYVRNGEKNGGAWVNEFQNRSDRRGEKPVAVVVLNLPVPDKDGKCLMPFREVETLFHEFGHALQCMLTDIGEEGAAGINLVEWDAVEVASQFMENWCLDKRTEIFLPEELAKKVKAAKNFRAASACRRQLSFGKVDMLLHGANVPEDPNALKNEIFKHFSLPAIEEDLFLNAFTHIFSGGYAAGYYGYKWSEVMSADLYGAFEEAGLDDDGAMQNLGCKFAKTILGLGGSKSAYEVFKLFRDRVPEVDAILRQQGLLN
jgi:oligopeptidase A